MANPQSFSNNSVYKLQLSYKTLVEESSRVKLQLTLKMYQDYSYGSYTTEQRPWNIKINGVVKASGTASYNFNNYNSLVLGSYIGWHNYSDGMTLSLSGYFSAYHVVGSATATYSWTLPIQLGKVYVGTSVGIKYGQVYIGTSSGVKLAKEVYIGTSSGVKTAR